MEPKLSQAVKRYLFTVFGYKYETGVNRIAVGRLHQLAQALGVDVAYFFAGLGGSKRSFTPQQRRLLELTRSFTATADARHRTALCDLARTLATAEPAEDEPPAAVA